MGTAGLAWESRILAASGIRLLTTTVGSSVSRVYAYDQRNNLTSALVDGLLTTFVYDGDGHHRQMSVAGEVTTYALE